MLFEVIVVVLVGGRVGVGNLIGMAPQIVQEMEREGLARHFYQERRRCVCMCVFCFSSLSKKAIRLQDTTLPRSD